MSRWNRLGIGLLTAAGAAAVTVALVTGGGRAEGGAPSTVSPAAATASASSAPPAGTSTPHGAWNPEDLRAQFEQWVPAELRAELAGLRSLPADQRLAELVRIRDVALAGGYGPQAKAAAERLVAVVEMLPRELYGDLVALVATEEAEIPDAVERIRDRALAGEYGTQVQGHAERLVAGAEQHGYDVRGDLDRYVQHD